MIESMTGFGNGRARRDGNTVEISLRSVNNKSFKLTMRMPDILSKTQQNVEQVIKDGVSRGTVYCLVEIDGPLAASHSLDETTVLNYCKALRRLAGKAGVRDDIGIEHIAALPGVVKEDKANTTLLNELVEEAAVKSLKSLLKSRRAEGKKLGDELERLISEVTIFCENVEKLRKKSLQSYYQKLKDRIKDLITRSGVKLNPDDIAREVAIIAERSDIAEEIERLKIHLKQIRKTMSATKPIGRELEFISQEMLREANTMSAKSLSSELVVPLLELKSNIDRIREQAQNVQ